MTDPVETVPTATVQVQLPDVAPPKKPTLIEAISAKRDQAKADLAAVEAMAQAEIEKSKKELALLETELASIPEHLKSLIYEDFVKKVDAWFK